MAQSISTVSSARNATADFRMKNAYISIFPCISRIYLRYKSDFYKLPFFFFRFFKYFIYICPLIISQKNFN